MSPCRPFAFSRLANAPRHRACSFGVVQKACRKLTRGWLFAKRVVRGPGFKLFKFRVSNWWFELERSSYDKQGFT